MGTDESNVESYAAPTQGIWSCGRCWIKRDAESAMVVPAVAVERVRELLIENPTAEACDLLVEIDAILGSIDHSSHSAEYRRGELAARQRAFAARRRATKAVSGE